MARIIAFIESPGGRRLPALYDRLIDAAGSQATTRLLETIRAIVAELMPVAVTAHNWRLAAAETLARGLALRRNDASGDPGE